MSAVQQNLKMRQVDFGVITHRDTLSPALLEVLEKGIRELNGCIILGYSDETARKTPLAVCHDETDYEEFVNHLHVEDFLPQEFQNRELLTQSYLYVTGLEAVLTSALPDRPVEITVALSARSCRVGFHCIRKDQAFWPEDLNEFSEPAMVIHLG